LTELLPKARPDKR